MTAIRIKKLFLFLVSISAIIIVVSCLWVWGNSYDKTYNIAVKTPFNEYALLPGTSKYMDNGKINLFFTYRCEAAAELWNKKMIKYIIISGDSTSSSYDEPELMKQELIRFGIPESVLITDKRGYNTQLSIIFCKNYGLKRLTIISQKFHNERAIVIANQLGINAVGYNAKPVYTSYGIRVWIRERFARVKLILNTIFN